MPSDPAALTIESTYWQQGYRRVAGADEAGRGCLAGPVVAAVVVFAEGVVLPGVADSKKLTADRRAALFDRIHEEALGVGVGRCSPQEIDARNILNAALEAMRRAAAACTPPPGVLLVDGNRPLPDPPCPQETFVKGDDRCHAIAAASIVAKVTRDRFMHALHEAHPQYGWDTNVGYPTKAHYEALAAYGPTLYHRHSFRLAPRSS